jgi:hypothetical protein
MKGETKPELVLELVAFQVGGVDVLASPAGVPERKGGGENAHWSGNTPGGIEQMELAGVGATSN